MAGTRQRVSKQASSRVALLTENTRLKAREVTARKIAYDFSHHASLRRLVTQEDLIDLLEKKKRNYSTQLQSYDSGRLHDSVHRKAKFEKIAQKHLKKEKMSY